MFAFLLLALSTALIGDDDARFQAGSDREVLQALAQGYTANRERVERCRASFVYREGRVPDMATARQGKLTDPAEAKGAYLFDGSRTKYERLFDREQTISHTSTGGEHPGTCEFISVQFLTDGSSSLSYNPFYEPPKKQFHKSALVESAAKNRFTEFASFPLDLGVKGPSTDGIAFWLERAWNHSHGVKAVKLRRDVMFEGRKVHVVTFLMEGGGWTYWIDYKRGCIPSRILIRTEKKGDFSDQYLEQVSLVGGKLWFPARSVLYNPTYRRVRILEVDKIQIDEAIADADFRLTFPEPITILDVVHSRIYQNAPAFSLPLLVHPDMTASRPARFH